MCDWSLDVCSSELGEHVVFSEDANGQVRALFGRKIEGLAAELPAVAPRVSSTQALASAKRAALGSRLLGMRVQAEQSRQVVFVGDDGRAHMRSEEHTSELPSLMRISYAVFCLKKKKK